MYKYSASPSHWLQSFHPAVQFCRLIPGLQKARQNAQFSDSRPPASVPEVFSSAPLYPSGEIFLPIHHRVLYSWILFLLSFFSPYSITSLYLLCYFALYSCGIFLCKKKDFLQDLSHRKSLSHVTMILLYSRDHRIPDLPRYQDTGMFPDYHTWTDPGRRFHCYG